jgi:hypothetical protein
MYNKLLTVFVLIIIKINCLAQPIIYTQKCFGSLSSESFNDVIQTSDGNFIATMNVGDIASSDFTDAPFSYAAAVIKFDTSLNIIWKKYLGGTIPSIGSIGHGTDFSKLIQTDDGSIFCFGGTNAADGIGVGNHGKSDLLLVKLDQNGNKIWSHVYGCPGDDSNVGMLVTYDKKIVFSGISNGWSGDIPFHYGNGFSSDGQLYKADSNGILQWVKVLGGSENNGLGWDIIAIDSTKYFFSLYSYSNDYDLSGTFGNADTLKRLMIIADTNGNILKKNIDRAYLYYDYETINQTKIINNKIIGVGMGISTNPRYPTDPSHHGQEGLVEVYDTALNLIKTKQFGGNNNDVFTAFCRDNHSNYYFTGRTNSINGDITSALHNGSDYWLIKTDSNLVIQWSRTFGGSVKYGEDNRAKAKIFIIGTKLFYWWQSTHSLNLPDFDIECGHYNPSEPTYSDAWVAIFDLNSKVGIEIKPSDIMTDNMFSIYPNPVSKILNLKSNQPDNKKFKATIINSSGKIVVKLRFDNTELNKIDISQLATGFYIFQIENQNGEIKNFKVTIN